MLHLLLQVWIFRVSIGRLQMEFERVCDSSGEDPSCSRSISTTFDLLVLMQPGGPSCLVPMLQMIDLTLASILISELS